MIRHRFFTWDMWKLIVFTVLLSCPATICSVTPPFPLQAECGLSSTSVG